jgi:hypothetical protein
MKPSRQNKPSSSSTRNPKLILPAAVDSRQDPLPNRGPPPPDPGPAVAGSRAMEKGSAIASAGAVAVEPRRCRQAGRGAGSTAQRGTSGRGEGAPPCFARRIFRRGTAPPLSASALWSSWRRGREARRRSALPGAASARTRLRPSQPPPPREWAPLLLHLRAVGRR